MSYDTTMCRCFHDKLDNILSVESNSSDILSALTLDEDGEDQLAQIPFTIIYYRHTIPGSASRNKVAR